MKNFEQNHLACYQMIFFVFQCFSWKIHHCWSSNTRYSM